MNRAKIAATLILLAAGILGAFGNSARAAQAINFVYDGNQLIEIDYDDGSSIIFNYDPNGNLVSRTVAGSQSQLYTITSSAGSGGTISPSEPQGVKVVSGSSYTFTITPDAGGQCISSVTVDGSSIGTPESYTFMNVTANHTISAAFATCTYPITVSFTGNGTITPGSGNVQYGSSPTFTIAANAGSNLYGVVVDGESEGAISSYTFTDVTAAHTISASFAPTYLISTSLVGYGTVSPISPTVNYGASPTFTITPPQGISIWDVQVDGVSQGAITSYTFNNVSADHTLFVTFNAIQNATSGATYSSLQAAYEAAQNGDTLKIQSGLLTEDFTADQPTSVTIDGGYTVDYSSNPGMTTIIGLETIGNGTVTWKNFTISN